MRHLDGEAGLSDARSTGHCEQPYLGAAQVAARFFHLALAPDQRRACIGKIV